MTARKPITRLLVGTLVVSCAALAGTAAARGVDPMRASQLASEAFIYGYPLAEFERVRAEMTSVTCPDRYGNAPVNELSNVGDFPRPQDKVVVAPNVDTLYTISHLDLSAGPVVLSHPDMGSRYFVFQFLDPYTNLVGYVGSRTTGAAAGRYALRWTGGPQSVPPGTTPIDLPYPRLWMIGRTLAGDAADQAAAKELIAQYSLTPPGGQPARPGCTLSNDRGNVKPPPAPNGIALLNAMSAAMEENPPPARDAAQLRRLAAIGVGPGLRVEEAKLSRLAQSAVQSTVVWMQRSLPKLVEAQQYATMLKHRGWSTPPSHIGDYGTDYLFRAGVAEIGLGANTQDEAAYRAAFLDSHLRPLDGRATYRLRFAPGQEPPNDAFWSVTVYDGDSYLPEVTPAIHAVGTSRPPLLRRPDGSVEIQFSKEPPTEPGVNWLPVPPSRFRVYLRVYAPHESVLNQTWRLPPIERVR